VFTADYLHLGQYEEKERKKKKTPSIAFKGGGYHLTLTKKRKLKRHLVNHLSVFPFSHASTKQINA
jgi:hypothetical protein